MSWRHWKIIIKNDECLSKIINIANACINLGHWPKYFKSSTTVVIPKPNKTAYDNPKAFQPIVLLNTLGKLVEKVIAERLQFLVASNNFVHPSQLGGLKFKSTSDVGIALGGQKEDPLVLLLLTSPSSSPHLIINYLFLFSRKRELT